MNNEVLIYLFNFCQEKEEKEFKIPSIRWLSLKLNISNNVIIRILNYFKDVGIITSIQGSQNFINKNKFLAFFKNDTIMWFGNDIKKVITNKKIKKINSKYVYFFDREFIKNNKIIMLSKDTVFLDKKVENFSKNFSIDSFIKKNVNGNKIVSKEVSIIDISGNNEYKKLKTKICVFVEVKINNERNIPISHSFSLFDVKYFKISKIELMI